MFKRYSVTKVGNYLELLTRSIDYSGLVLEVMAQWSKSHYSSVLKKKKCIEKKKRKKKKKKKYIYI